MKKFILFFTILFCVRLQAAETSKCFGWQWNNENYKGRFLGATHYCVDGSEHFVRIVYLNRVNKNQATVSAYSIKDGKTSMVAQDKREVPYDELQCKFKEYIGRCVPAKKVVASNLKESKKQEIEETLV